MELVYKVKDRPPFGKTLVFALQQLLAILAATIAVPAVVGMAKKYGLAIPCSWAKYKIAFVASMHEPPPNAITISGRTRSTPVTPASTSSWLGSGLTSEYV